MRRCHAGLFTVTFVVAVTSHLMGTSISVVVDHRKITIAADSRISGNDSSGRAASASECKIHIIHNLLFISAGRYKDVNAGFDVLEIASLAIEKGSTVSMAMDSLTRTLNTRLPSVISSARIRTPNDYHVWIGSKVPVLSIAFGSIENGHAKVINCDFLLDREGGAAVPHCDTKQPEQDGDSVWLGLGSSDVIKWVASADRAATSDAVRRNRVKFVRASVELEIAANQMLGRDEIAPPISVATFDSSGLHWIDRGVCQVQNKK